MQYILFMVIWHQTYGEGPVKTKQETCHHHKGHSIATRNLFICTFPQTEQYILWPTLHLCYTSYGWNKKYLNGSTKRDQSHDLPDHEEDTKSRVGLNPIGPIAPNWAPRPILQTTVQVDWEPGLTEIFPNWAPHILRQALIKKYIWNGDKIILLHLYSQILIDTSFHAGLQCIQRIQGSRLLIQ